MIILENTDRFAIGLHHEQRVMGFGHLSEKVVTVRDRENDTKAIFYGHKAEEFLAAFNHMNASRTHPASMHYTLTFNESIAIIVDCLHDKVTSHD